MSSLVAGDYVLATKYADGDPYDGWAVGFYHGPLAGRSDRHMVVDEGGQQYRANGFRRVEKISSELGEWIVANRYLIEARTHFGGPINIWRYKYGGSPARKALLDDAGPLSEFIGRNAVRYGWNRL